MFLSTLNPILGSILKPEVELMVFLRMRSNTSNFPCIYVYVHLKNIRKRNLAECGARQSVERYRHHHGDVTSFAGRVRLHYMHRVHREGMAGWNEGPENAALWIGSAEGGA